VNQQFQPPKPKTSNFIPIVLGIACLVFGSCGIWLGYIFYEASTPEGKRAAKDLDEKTDATLDGFIGKMALVRAGLPATDSPAVKCPAGTIPSPTVGKTDLDEALAKDFEKNVEAATKVSLAAIDVK